ncbi:hypothetical protein COD19_25495, partial [Bacillus cereus]
MDGGSNTVIATITVGINPLGIATNPITKRVYNANGSGSSNNVSVIDALT